MTCREAVKYYRITNYSVICGESLYVSGIFLLDADVFTNIKSQRYSSRKCSRRFFILDIFVS